MPHGNQAYLNSNKVKIITDMIYYYCLHDDSAYHQSFNSKKYTEIYANEKTALLFENYPEIQKQYWGKYLFHCFSVYMAILSSKKTEIKYQKDLVSRIRRKIKYLHYVSNFRYRSAILLLAYFPSIFKCSYPYFEIYSSVDERSAAFIACGLAAESGEPVALSCTGATASRNYIPGLTEAYYRKLPILAITASQHLGRVQNGCSQVIDRGTTLNDIVKESVVVDCVYTQEDEWACGATINKALIALRRNGGGPVHINHVTTYNKDFSVKELPKVKGIRFTESFKKMPEISREKKIVLHVGVHRKWSEELAKSMEEFCQLYNAVVVANHASNYKGDYGVNPGIIFGMQQYTSPNRALVIATLLISLAKPMVGILLVLNSEDKVTARILGLMLVELIGYSFAFIVQMRRGKKFCSLKFWKYAVVFNLPLIVCVYDDIHN